MASASRWALKAFRSAGVICLIFSRSSGVNVAQKSLSRSLGAACSGVAATWGAAAAWACWTEAWAGKARLVAGGVVAGVDGLVKALVSATMDTMEDKKPATTVAIMGSLLWAGGVCGGSGAAGGLGLGLDIFCWGVGWLMIGS